MARLYQYTDVATCRENLVTQLFGVSYEFGEIVRKRLKACTQYVVHSRQRSPF